MSQQNFNQTIKTIRILGVISLLLSGFVFLWQGYYDWNGFERFMAFFGLNTVVAGLGIFCAQVWREPKGARTMLALATAGISVQVAQAGGMIYEAFNKWFNPIGASGGGDVTTSLKQNVPEIFGMVNVSLLELGISLGLLVLSAPLIAKFSYKVLDGNRRKEFLTLLTVNSLFLILPFRSTYLVILNLLNLGALIYHYQKEGRFPMDRILTFEFWISLVISCIPMFIHVIRDFFYTDSVTLSLSVFFMACTLISLIYEKYRKTGPSVDTVIVKSERTRRGSAHTVFYAAMTWLFLPWDILDKIDLSFVYNVFILVAPLSLCFCELYKRNRISSMGFETLSAALLGAYSVMSLVEVNVAGGMCLFIVASIHMVYSACYPNKRVFKLASLVALMGLMAVVYKAIALKFAFSWINLAIAGVLTVLGASLLEKKANQIREIHADFMKRF